MAVSQDTTTITATFDYHDEGMYYFTENGEDEETYTFVKAEASVLKAYDLTDEKYEGKTFKVTYKTETEEDEFEEEYEVLVITKLELVK